MGTAAMRSARMRSVSCARSSGRARTPFVAPIADGGVLAAWRADPLVVSIECDAGGGVRLHVRDWPGNVYWTTDTANPEPVEQD